ncbi:aspartate/glutamate racemase family protein [Rhizorhabdus wittichii]|uniref:Aspartate/glutamate racemase family protein n=1 Tax=Rhizorhabdus wittichii TaxID=160791 RepID=A0A975D6U2_9SPHN|nr:aspartate/glutamate racemase family protein [Rhizorhabdus wittichii]QTH23987.1 aspartate/glutamate racemase family protein [Rhizorhabdus wittichii]
MIHIRILVPVTTNAIRQESDLAHLDQPGVRYSIAFIDTGPTSIESRFDEVFALPGMVALALEAEADGVDAVVIDCMGDPGLAALREAVSLPVIGVAQTAMATISSLAHSFGIVSVAASTGPIFRDLVAIYGMERHYVGARAIDIPVVDLKSHNDDVKEALAENAITLVRDHGAEAVILGCTGFFGCAAYIRERLGALDYRVPVIDPLPFATLMAAALVRHGISHSRISYPANPRIKPVKGYALPG